MHIAERTDYRDRLQTGDMDAFRELVNHNKQKVYGLCRQLTGNHPDAEDLSQEVFIKAFQSMKSFRGNSEAGTWLYRITVNAFIDKKRKKMHHTVSIDQKDSQTENGPVKDFTRDTTNDPERHTESALIQAHINRALDTLSARERVAFISRHYQDASIREIAKTMRTSEGTVKSMLFRSVKKLQKALAAYRAELGLEEA